MTHVATQAHEFEGWLKFAANGLDPYWMLAQMYIYDVDGQTDYRVEAEVDGEPWEISYSYHKSGIAARDEDAVDGRLYEWDLVGRGPGESKAAFQVKPRFEGMEHHETGEPIDSPWMHLDADEGIAVEVDGSNVDPTRFPDLLRGFVDAVAEDLGRAVDPDYFRRPLVDGGAAASNITALETYVRVERDLARKVVQQGGVFDRLVMLLADQRGTQGGYEWDNEDALGKHHRLELSPTDAAQLGPDHTLGKQIKHYLLKNPDSVDEDDPTWHPKIGAKFDKRLDGDAVPWRRLDDVRQELDEVLLNVLDWSDVPIEAGPTFVPDDHFQAVERAEDVPIYADPTPALEAKQEHLLVTAMRDMSPGDVDVLEAIADGGRAHYQDVADRAGRSVATVYRALQRLEGILDSDDGVVDFETPRIAEDIRGIVDHIERSVESAADRVAELYDLHAAGAARSSFQQWLNKYGAELEVSDDGPERLRIDSLLAKYQCLQRGEFVEDVIWAGLRAWKEDGRDPISLKGVVVDWEDTFGDRHRQKLSTILN